MRTALLAAAVVSLSGCAGYIKSASSADTALANEPLYCEGAEQCTTYWKRAQVWIASNGHYRVRTVTDSIINTEGPVYAELWYAYQVTKEPQAGNREQIRIAMNCGNRFTCLDHPDKVAADFKRYVRAAAP